MAYLTDKIHLVAFDIPSPPNYGGVIDVYYKIEALHKLGIAVELHCWQYGGREPDIQLTKLCYKVHYYKRNRFMNPFNGPLPYIVKTRYSQELLQNLKKDDSPILFEGLHTTAPLFYKELEGRFTVIRNHNIESDYYRLLSEKETKPFKRTYLKQEARLLFKYEEVLKSANAVAAISVADKNTLESSCNVEYIPAFHPNDKVTAKVGNGKYALYHGNLAVAENNEAALFLVNEVYTNIDSKLIIAGNKASKELIDASAKCENIEIREHLSIAEFDTLMRNASINVLPTFQPTGIKLKLLNALYKGRHCLVNDHMVGNSGLEALCVVANSGKEFAEKIELLKKIDFEKEDIDKREAELNKQFNNDQSAQMLMDLFP